MALDKDTTCPPHRPGKKPMSLVGNNERTIYTRSLGDLGSNTSFECIV